MKEQQTLQERIEELPQEVKDAIGRAIAFQHMNEPKLWKTHSERFDFELWKDNKFNILLQELLPNEVARAKIQYTQRVVDAERLTEEDFKKKEELLRKLQSEEPETSKDDSSND